MQKKGIIKEAGKPMPIYEQIRSHLADGIKNGLVKNGEELPPVAKMVKELDVGYQAVKSALELLEEDGLIRFKNGKGRGKRPVVTLPEVDKKNCSITFLRATRDSLDLQITQGISNYEIEHNLDTIIIDSPNSHKAFVESIKNPGTDGLVILPYNHPEIIEAINIATEKGIEVVLVDRELKGTKASSVSIDHTQGAYMACSHLFEQNNEPIFYLTYNSETSSLQDRYNGWKVAMMEHGYHPDTLYCKAIKKSFVLNKTPIYDRENDSNFLDKQYVFALKFFQENKRKLYNIFTVNDYMAKGVYLAAEKMGLTIGKDVFIVGFGNSPFCERLDITLSSVNQKNREIGYEAAKLLYMKIAGSLKRAIHRKIKPELIIRKSSQK
jgi:LacI family transcriptional regulator